MKKYLILFSVLLLLQTPVRSQWTTVCQTGNGFVDNMEVFNGELWCTGFYTTLCGIPMNHVARYDGSTWQPVGNGFPFAGHQLKALDGQLWLAPYQPGVDSNHVFRFDGTGFQPVGTGVYLTTAIAGFSQTPTIYALCKYNGNVVAAGEFDRVGARHIRGIMQWNGSDWDSVGGGLSGNIAGTAPVMYPHDLCLYNGDLVVAGNFAQAGGVSANGIARWDGNQWHAFGPGFNSTVYGVTVYNGELYAGGDFTQSETTPLKYIAKWNGTAWVDPGFRMYYINPNDYTFIHTLKVIDTTLYVAGGFDRVEFGSRVYRCQAVCGVNPTGVDTLQGGISGREIEAVAWHAGHLWVGGGINNNNSYIARYGEVAGLAEPRTPVAAVSVIPNPSYNGEVHVTASHTVVAYRLVDVRGRVVQTGRPGSKKFTVRQPSWGLYQLILDTEGGQVAARVVFTGSW